MYLHQLQANVYMTKCILFARGNQDEVRGTRKIYTDLYLGSNKSMIDP